MSLYIDIINKPDRTNIKPTEELTVILDDNLSTLKEKLFCMTEGIEWHHRLIKVEVLDDKTEKYNVITADLPMLFYLGENNNVVYVTNLLQVIEDEVDINKVFIEEDVFTQEFERLSKEYIDLTENDFKFIIDLKMLESNPEIYQHLQSEIAEYISSGLREQSDLREEYLKSEKSLAKFYKEIKTIKDYSPFFELDESDNISFMFNNVSIIVTGNNVVDGIEGNFIKLNQIFNVFELNDRIPFIAIKSDKKTEPIIKVHNKLLNYTSDKEMKSWILNEKKKLGLTTYKKFKGLVFKYQIHPKHFITVNLLQNGILNLKLSFTDEQNENNIDNILSYFRECIDYISNTLNQIKGIYKKNKKLMPYNKSSVTINSLTGSATTTFLIHRPSFSMILNNQSIRKNFFEIKDILSQDTISLYYKRLTKAETEEETEARGLTINIQDNPYKMDSSIITIYSAENLSQIHVILKELIAISEMAKMITTFSPERQQRLKERSHIKALRKQGVKILSTKCQKPRQPIIPQEDTIPLPGSYILNHDGKQYICPKREYPYPGFTNENIVCCFKKDQRRRDTYIRNTKSADFDVQVAPSNFKITIKDPETEKSFETFAIKVVSSYVNGFEDVISRYYYISDDNQLVEITNESLIENLLQEEENNIWLDSVPLTKIITTPPKNKCNFPPDMNNKKPGDINSPCSHYPQNKIFGYNLNSYPCCFDKEREVQFARKKKISDITKQHILISDKILEYQRLGVLPSGLNTLFNNIIPSEIDGKFYRMGVVQNNSSFLNAILLALNNRIGNTQINNSVEFRKYIVSFLSDPKSDFVFQKLNGANIYLKYGTPINYTNMILDINVPVYWNDYVDIIQRITDINIIILEIPYVFSESTKTADYKNIRILCNPYITYDYNKPFVILLKRQNTYETIVFIGKSEEQTEESIMFQFGYKSDKKTKESIINFLVKYYEESCIRENIFPQNFPFIEMFMLSELQEKLNGTPFELVAQVVNRFNKIDYGLTKKGLLIPIKESGIKNDLPIVQMQNIIKNDKLVEVKKYILGFNSINKILGNDSDIKILGLSTEKQDNTEYSTAIMTNYGYFIPVKRQNVADIQKSVEISILDYKYYSDANDYIYTSQTAKQNEQVLYSLRIAKFKELMFRIKTVLANELSNDKNSNYKEQIEDIIITNMLSRGEKIDKLIKVLSVFSEAIDTVLTIEKRVKNFMFHEIANEMLNDNVERLLLNNLVTYEIFNPDEIIKRDDESILTSIDELQNWIKRYKIPI